jgi:hypothetical protein
MDTSDEAETAKNQVKIRLPIINSFNFSQLHISQHPNREYNEKYIHNQTENQCIIKARTEAIYEPS